MKMLTRSRRALPLAHAAASAPGRVKEAGLVSYRCDQHQAAEEQKVIPLASQR